MNIGKLDRRIRIQSVHESRDAYGETLLTFGDWLTVSASYRALRVTEKFMSQHLQGEIEAIFTIRYMPGVSEKWRIEYEGVTYEIVGPPKEIGRHEGLELHSRLVR